MIRIPFRIDRVKIAKTASSLIFALSLLLILNSCEKKDLSNNELESNINSKTWVYEKSSNDEKAIVLARVFGISLNNSNFRAFIKSKALELWDGDYDILYENIKNIIIPGTSFTVNQFLLNVANQYGQSLNPTVSFTETDLQRLMEIYEDFQISVPVLCDEWNTALYVPLVTFIPEDYEEETYTNINAYNSSGTVFQLSLEEDPLNPVVVLSSCERIEYMNNLKAGSKITEDVENKKRTPFSLIAFTNLSSPPEAPTMLTVNSGFANQLILEWNDNSNVENGFIVERSSSGSSGFIVIASLGVNVNSYVDNNLQSGSQYFYRVKAYNNIGSSNYTNISQYFASPRSDSNHEIIEKMKFTDLNHYEKWISGAPEIRVRVAIGTANTSTFLIDGDFVEPKKRRDINNTWFVWNHSLLRWYTSLYGKVLTLHFTEEDPGIGEKDVKFMTSWEEKTSTSTTIRTGAEISFKTAKKDDVITYKPIVWWHSFTESYDNGKFYWIMKSSTLN